MNKFGYWYWGIVSLIIIALIILRTVTSIVDEAVIIDLTPSEITLFTERNQTANAEIKVHVQNAETCEITCNINIKSISQNELIKNYALKINEEKVWTETIPIRSPEYGHGEEYYHYQISCVPRGGLSCNPKEPKIQKTLFIINSYNITQNDQYLKNQYEAALAIRSEELENASYDISYAVKILEDSFVNEILELNLSKDNNSLNKEIQKYELNLNYWKNEEYDKISLGNFSKFQSTHSIIRFYQADINQRIYYNNIKLNPDAKTFYLKYSAFEQELNTADDLLKLGFNINHSIVDYNWSLNKLNQTIVDLNNKYAIANAFLTTQLPQINKQLNTSFQEYDCDVFYGNLSSLNLSNNDSKLIAQYCYPHNLSISLTHKNISVSNINTSKTAFEKPSEPLANCCVYEQCNSCSTNPEVIMFIHGHKFNDANSPELSMSAFVKIQDKLASESIINTGQLQLDMDDDWSRIPGSISLRASYYYISAQSLAGEDYLVRSSERIENYALRFAELLQLTKLKTKDEKITIVAHSMGGLVAREYIALFGSDNVEKLILINVPNHGISDRIARYCRIIGNNYECDDMNEGSVFLERLNSRPIKNLEIVNIVSKGCNMPEGDGDGIVSAESAELGWAKNYFINGSCTDRLNSNLHTDALNPDLYPEVYKIILEEIK